LSARAVLFGTRVDKDQIFNEQAGRNIVGGSTTRLGGLIQGRLRGSFFDLASHLTVVQSKFDDTNTLVPYVPDAVVRMDASLFHDAWFSIRGTRPRGSLGLGVTFVGRRPLPFGQRSDAIFTSDINAEVAWRFVTVAVSSTNVFNAQYRLAEFNYTSDFRPAGSFPTLVPVRHFTAGSPRQVFFTISFNVGGT
jgi:iron complex outermembrane recepter protein